MHLSPNFLQPCPFESKSQPYSSTQSKPSSPEAPASHTPPHEPQDLEQPGTPVPTEDPEAVDTGEFIKACITGLCLCVLQVIKCYSGMK